MSKAPKLRTCRRCGCTWYNPCVSRITGMSCAWVERDLCSSCLSPTEKKRFEAGDKTPSQGRK